MCVRDETYTHVATELMNNFVGHITARTELWRLKNVLKYCKIKAHPIHTRIKTQMKISNTLKQTHPTMKIKFRKVFPYTLITHKV